MARGEVSQQNLWQQLTNPTTAQPHRELLSSVLNTFNANQRVVSPNILIQPSPAVPIPIPPVAAAVAAKPGVINNANLLFQPPQNPQMRLSPLPNGIPPQIPQRIPSPRELQYHTQSIMQNALIRKKLEEQRENFRKRQEAQAQQQAQTSQPSSGGPTSTADVKTTSVPSGNEKPLNQNIPSHTSPAKQQQHTSSPTPLAFTPTSVLRKMTAEKDTDHALASSTAVSSSTTTSSAQNVVQNPIGTGSGNQSQMSSQPQHPHQQPNQQNHPNMMMGMNPQRNMNGPFGPGELNNNNKFVVASRG